LRSAVAIGAYSVEHIDATTGIPPWEQAQQRLKTDWSSVPVRLLLPNWQWQATMGIWHGPGDQARGAAV